MRVAWLFGPGGNNFVTKILAGAEKYGALQVAADEFGNPTYAPDAAAAMARLADTGHYGIYHLTNSGFCSRYEFAARDHAAGRASRCARHADPERRLAAAVEAAPARRAREHGRRQPWALPCAPGRRPWPNTCATLKAAA